MGQKMDLVLLRLIVAPSSTVMASIVISKFLHCTILVTISAKSFFQQNFNLKWTRIQRGLDLRCCWMFFFTVEKGLLARP
jgi:hypothetical protein